LLDSLLQEKTKIVMPGVLSVPEYTTVLGQTFSPDGELYAACSVAGKVSVWRVSDLLTKGTRKPLASFNVSSVLCLGSTGGYLVTGGRGEVKGWSWSKIMSGEVVSDWVIELQGKAVDVNSMVVTHEGTEGRLIVGAGDNNVYMYDLETREKVTVLEGHTGYVHCVDARTGEGGEGLVVSGSEDGTVRLWDPRKKESIHSLTPSDQTDLSRPHLGRHIGAVSLSSGDWLACGGGPRAAMWHLRSYAPAASLPPGDQEVKVVGFHDEVVMVGGGGGVLYQTNISGEVTAEVATSCNMIYSLAWQQVPSILCVAGSSSNIDICAPNFNYKDATISFPVL